VLLQPPHTHPIHPRKPTNQAIGRNFEEAIQKAVRMVNPNLDGLEGKCDDEQPLDPQIQVPTDR
jgi:hypothetical protein